MGLKREEERNGEGLEYENKMYCNKEIERHPPPTPKKVNANGLKGGKYGIICRHHQITMCHPLPPNAYGGRIRGTRVVFLPTSSAKEKPRGNCPHVVGPRNKQAFFVATLGLPHQTFEIRTSAFAASIRSATLIASLY